MIEDAFDRTVVGIHPTSLSRRMMDRRLRAAEKGVGAGVQYVHQRLGLCPVLYSFHLWL